MLEALGRQGTNFTAINSKTITDWGNLLEYNLQNLPQSVQRKEKKTH